MSKKETQFFADFKALHPQSYQGRIFTNFSRWPEKEIVTVHSCWSGGDEGERGDYDRDVLDSAEKAAQGSDTAADKGEIRGHKGNMEENNVDGPDAPNEVRSYEK
ncbi:MAG: hypothetical protein U5N86_10525 [Planctomycetota bacterium]|nr:hypothetical protein [Planctomycetota bacterium]